LGITKHSVYDFDLSEEWSINEDKIRIYNDGGGICLQLMRDGRTNGDFIRIEHYSDHKKIIDLCLFLVSFIEEDSLKYRADSDEAEGCCDIFAKRDKNGDPIIELKRLIDKHN
jgi:hypothetical protein